MKTDIVMEMVRDIVYWALLLGMGCGHHNHLTMKSKANVEGRIGKISDRNHIRKIFGNYVY